MTNPKDPRKYAEKHHEQPMLLADTVVHEDDGPEIDVATEEVDDRFAVRGAITDGDH